MLYCLHCPTLNKVFLLLPLHCTTSHIYTTPQSNHKPITVISLHVSDIIVYVCIPYHLHIPPSHSLSRFSPVATVNVLHHISHHTTVITTRLGYNGVSLYIVCIPYHLHIPPSHSLSRFSPVATVNVLHHISHHTTVITTRLGYNGVSSYMSVYHTTYTFHLHTPSSYLLSRFSPVATVNVLHHISHHITVITLHVWVTMRYHCICVYTIPPTHSTFTLPPLISSTGSHLWSRSTYYITYHTTPLLSHYTFGLQWGIIVYRLYTTPPTHSIFKVPYLITFSGSHLWQQSNCRTRTRKRKQNSPHDPSVKAAPGGRTAGT